jgi:acetyl-CoA acyltransferase
VSDGAAAVLLMRRSKAKELGIKPLARFLTFAVVCVLNFDSMTKK